MWPNFWILKKKLHIGGLWIATNKNEKLAKVNSVQNVMSTGKDVLIEFLLELLKEERDQRRRETEENVSLIKDLMSKFDRLETDLIFEHHTRHMHRRSGRIVCDGDEDEVDGWGHFRGKWPHRKRKRGHPRWRPEAEEPPFSSALRNGDRKTPLILLT